MGYLINAWNETQKKFSMTLKQIVNIAGDEYLETEEAVDELREFFSLIDIPTMDRLFQECYSKDKKLKFDARGFAFQDLINEMGRRLGYEVEHGVYRGKRNEIGFDGLWQAEESYIVMEAKATGDYAFDPGTVIHYRDILISERRIPRNKCSILIVYGSDEKSALKNSVKGSDGSTAIRLISANALFQLVKIASTSHSPTLTKQIYTLLRPRDYFVLDNLVELVFPETDAHIPPIDDDPPDPPEPPEPPESPEPELVYTGKKMKIWLAADTIPDGATTFYLDSKTIQATGYSFGTGITVLKGSQYKSKEGRTLPTYLQNVRRDLQYLVQDDVLTRSLQFESTSSAAAYLLGVNMKGPIVWKTADGVPYKRIFGTLRTHTSEDLPRDTD